MLIYEDAPAQRRLAPPMSGRDVPAGYDLSIGRVVAILRRRWLWMVLCAAAFATLALFVGKSLTPRFTATAQIYIDPRDLQLATKELTAGGLDATGYQTIVESQARLITSSNVLRRVVESNDLTHDDEFVGPGDVGLIATVKGLLGIKAAPQAEAGDDLALTMDALERRVGVQRTGKTYIVDVSVWSRDAAKAARLANAVVSAYLAAESSARATAAGRANAAITARLGELRETVKAAEDRVQDYKTRTGLVGTRDTLVTDQQLTQLNSQLNAARGKVVEAQSRVDQIQRVRNAGLDAGASDDVLSSQAIATLRSQYAELTRRQAELMNDLGPRHPQVASIDKQVRQVRGLIDQEVGRYAQAARTELARARATATALETNFERAKERTVGLAEASIRLRELEREADASRTVYEAFLARARETGQQAFLDTGNARVVTEATKPLTRSYPPPVRVLVGLGLMAGLGLGLLVALIDDWSRFGASRSRALREIEPPEVADPNRHAETDRRSVVGLTGPGTKSRGVW